jgi:hypothetical protein
VRGKGGAERAEGSFVRHGGKIADAMNLKTKKTRAFFQDAIDVNKSGLVELVAPRRVVPPVVGRNGYRQRLGFGESVA